MDNQIKIKTVPNEDLDERMIDIYGLRVGANYDIIISDIMRQHMTDPEDKNAGLGMAKSYELTSEDPLNPVESALLVVWESDEKVKATGPNNFYSGTPTITALSLSANLIALSHLSFLDESEELGTAFKLIRQYIGNGCETFKDEDITETFAIID